jgi:glyoxylase I family protein
MSRIEHFAIYATETTSLKDFYVESFGLRVIVQNQDTPPGYFLSDEGGMALEIIGRPRGESALNQRWTCHLAFVVEDVAAIRAALERRGIVFETETAVHTSTMQTAFFNDPEGNRCQIVWREPPLGKR